MSSANGAAEPEVLRVLVLADASSIHTEQWIRGLAESGAVELHLATMNPAGVRAGLRDIRELVAIHEVYAGAISASGGNWRYLANAPRLWRAINRTKPDAIVALYLSSYGLMAAALKGGATLVHAVLGTDVMVTPERSVLHRALARWALSRGDLVVSASEATSDRVRAVSRIPRDAILTQQYGLDDGILNHGILPTRYDFVSNRAWVPNSNIQQVIAIFKQLDSAKSLVLIDSGSSLDSTIRTLASSDPRIHVLGALQHRENIDVVAQSAFYISMTASDGASLSLMEAMALGAIPVVSDIAPNREWIADGENGALLPLSDPPAAAARVNALLALPLRQHDEIRRRNQEIVRQRGSRRRSMALVRQRIALLMRNRPRASG